MPESGWNKNHFAYSSSENMDSAVRARLRSKLKWVLRPLYHAGFRSQLRLRCFLDDLSVQLRRKPSPNIPPAMIRYRVAESVDAAKFVTIGQGCARLIEEQLMQMGIVLDAPLRILDFGCGCGRVLRFLMESAPAADFHGIDVDKAAIDWCVENLKGARFRATSPDPPLPYLDAHFDVVFCVSVFTHLDELHQDAWLKELRRVLKPGGALLFTVHGAVAAELLDGKERQDLQRRGFICHQSKKLHGIVPDWYHTTWHSKQYIVERASQWFSDVQYSVISDSTQDVVRCRAKSPLCEPTGDNISTCFD